MTKQRLEATVKELICDVPHSWYMKIQVNQMAHCKTVGDFMFITSSRNLVIECKECNGTSFPFSRFTQKDLLEKFHNALPKNRGFLIISFWKGTKKKTNYYIVPVCDMIDIMKQSTKKSANEKDLELYYYNYGELRGLGWTK
jgi:penicillin-binding protein-related factor A (putative recombinase)